VVILCGSCAYYGISDDSVWAGEDSGKLGANREQNLVVIRIMGIITLSRMLTTPTQNRHFLLPER
jgi:hypothetical protein